MILKFEPQKTKGIFRPSNSSPIKRFSQKIRYHLAISNENSTALIKANLSTGFIEIELTVFGLSNRITKHILEPYESIKFLHSNNFLLSLDLSNLSPGSSAISCVRAMNIIATTAIYVERDLQVVRF